MTDTKQQSEDTTKYYFDRDAVPQKHFGEWLYGKPLDFPGASFRDIPPLMKARGLARVGFIPFKTAFMSGCVIKIREEFYRLLPTNNEDFTDHTFTTKNSVDGWELLKMTSRRLLESSQSNDASPKQS